MRLRSSAANARQRRDPLGTATNGQRGMSIAPSVLQVSFFVPHEVSWEAGSHGPPGALLQQTCSRCDTGAGHRSPSADIWSCSARTLEHDTMRQSTKAVPMRRTTGRWARGWRGERAAAARASSVPGLAGGPALAGRAGAAAHRCHPRIAAGCPAGVGCGCSQRGDWEWQNVRMFGS